MGEIVRLHSGSVSLRPWRTEDVEALASLADNREVWRNLRDAFPRPYTRADAAAWIAGKLGVEPVTSFAIESTDGGELAGSISFVPLGDVHRRTAEIGYFVGEPYWGRGFATEAVRALATYAFERFDLVRLEAGVFEWNPASMRVLEKAGFALEGRLAKSVTKDGALIDSMLYARVRG